MGNKHTEHKKRQMARRKLRELAGVGKNVNQWEATQGIKELEKLWCKQ